MLTNELFEQLIEIAGDNGYGRSFPIPNMEDHNLLFSITLLTSNAFIQAFSQHLWNKRVQGTLSQNKTLLGDVGSIRELSDRLTTSQAIAIRDGELIEFYSKLI